MDNDNESTAIAKWEDVGESAILYIEEPNDTRLEAIIGKCSDAIGYVIPYAGKVIAVINLVKPDPIMIKFNEITCKFKELDRKLDRMMSEIKSHFKMAEYKRHLDNLNRLQMLFNRYSENPNKATLGALHEVGYNDPITFAHWLYLEVTGQNMSPFFQFMKEDNDYPKFLNWSSLIVTHFMNSVLYHTLLMRTKDDISKEEIEKTLEKDTKDFNSWLHDIKEVINSQIKWMQVNYLQHMERKVIDTFSGKPTQKIKEEAENMLKFVSEKYPFRKWFVGVVRVHRFTESIKVFEKSDNVSLDSSSQQTALLLEYDKSGRAAIANFKSYMDNLSFIARNNTLTSYRLIIISSTLPDQLGQYKESVKNIISGIDERTYRKHNGWIKSNLAESHRLAVKEKLSDIHNSEVMAFHDLGPNCIRQRFEAHFTCDAQGAFYHHHIAKKPLLIRPWQVNIITIKLD